MIYGHNCNALESIGLNAIANRLIISLVSLYRHQIRTYTQQLVKDTDGILKDLVSNNNDRHLKIQRERLVDEFTTALTSFQVKYSDRQCNIYCFV